MYTTRSLIFAALLAIPALHAQPIAKLLDAPLETMVRDQKIPGLAIGIVKDGALVYSRGFGFMNLDDSKKPITPETLFHMASITKLFVGTSVMQLWEQGIVDLDAPVVQYLPYFQLKDPRYRSI